MLTKCGRRWEGRLEGVIENDLRPESIREECERSLRRLGLERIDLYQFHWPDWMTGTAVEDSRGTMAELVEEGKARWIGVANFDPEQLDRCGGDPPRRLVQPPLSLLARGARRTVVPWAAAHGTGVIVCSPMGSGLLTGAFDRERIERLDPNDWRRESPAFRDLALGRNLELVDRLRGIAERIGATMPELAVAWALAQPGVTAAIVGARLPRHVEGWLGASSSSFSPACSTRSTTRWLRVAERRAAPAASARAAHGRSGVGVRLGGRRRAHSSGEPGRVTARPAVDRPGAVHRAALKVSRLQTGSLADSARSRSLRRHRRCPPGRPPRRSRRSPRR